MMALLQQAVPAEKLSEIFDRAALLAVSPMLALTVGAVLLLVVAVAPPLKPARGLITAMALVLAFIGQVRIFQVRPGLVLDETLMADRTAALWGMIFVASTTLAWLFSHRYYTGEDRPFETEHDALMLMATVGMMLMAGAQDLVVFFVGLELLSIPLYALAAFRRNRPRSIEAGLKYFLLGAFAAAFFVYGAALVYAGTGTLSLVELQGLVDTEIWRGNRLAGAGAALIAASLFFKASVFPFQVWVPDVYEGSPTPVTALMATGTKAAAFAFLLNAVFLLPPSTAISVALIALLTMAIGNLGALVQDDLKRMLAYSAIAHAGTVLLVVAGAMAGGGEFAGAARDAALFYMAAYVFTAAGAFGLLALLEQDGEHFTRISSLRGLAASRPGIAAALTLFLLSLGGIPVTGGFLGKYLVFTVAYRAGFPVCAVLAALLSVIALAYYLRVVVAMYMQPQPEGQEAPATSHTTAALATGLCALAVLVLGVLPAWFLDRL